MSGLERKAHRLVELARSGGDPSAAQLLSLHGAVSARIAAEGAAGSVGATAGWKAAGASGVVKGLLAAGALAAGVAGYWALPEHSAPAAHPVARPTTPPPPAPVAPAAAPAPPPSSAPAPSFARPSKAPALRLQDEAALLAAVQVSLRGGRPGEALAKLDSYDRRFASGMLRAEADAARVFALCAAGRIDKARAAAERFVLRYPNAPATARVQAACN